MALTKIGKEGITGVSNAANATFLTATSAEGVTLAGTLAVTGVHTVGTNAVATSEGGAVTTNITQGLVKAWFNLNAIGTEAYRDTFNIGSVTDNATGDFSHNFTNDMASANHATANSTSGNDSTTGVNSYNMYFEPQSTGAGFTRSQNISSGGTALDVGYVIGMVAGDLA